jgi:hypothetical protein
MDTEGEEVQAKDIKNICNEVIAGNCPNLVKEMIIQVEKDFRTLNR